MTLINTTLEPSHSELGKKTNYDSHYNPDKLFPIARKTNRTELGIMSDKLPFYGFDQWNHYEVSWLNQKGKPIVALATITYGCDSPNIIEAKSMKLYFNSLNNSQFANETTVQNLIKNDLEQRIGAPVHVNIILINTLKNEKIYRGFSGTCLDDLDIECSIYQPEPNFLVTEKEIVEETVYSDLLKSNCLVTHQPDWGSVQIHYQGCQINHKGLLQYLVSFRNHNEFNEQCIERIFVDIMRSCAPKELTV